MSGVRRTTRTGFPRHSILSIAPGSSLLMSISTGAPSALARALGFQEARNGTAANATPAAPVRVVAAVKSCRRPLSIDSLIGRFSFGGGIAALYTAIAGNPCAAGVGAAAADLRSGKERGARCIVIHERRVTPPDRKFALPRGVVHGPHGHGVTPSSCGFTTFRGSRLVVVRRVRNALHASCARIP